MKFSHRQQEMGAAVLSIVLAGAIGYLGFEIGLMQGKKQGYAKCVAEEDDDYPRTYSEQVGPVPEERL